MSQEDFDKVFKRAFKSHDFHSFDKVPIASASIGQVHIAYLNSKEKVAVKLRREGIKKEFLQILELLIYLIFYLNLFFHIIQKIQLKQLFQNFHL